MLRAALPISMAWPVQKRQKNSKSNKRQICQPIC